MMPSRLPRRAVDGCDNPLSARMKQTDATRYQRATWLALMMRSPRQPSLLLGHAGLRLFFPEHLEHSLRDEEAAERVDRGERDGDHTHPAAPVHLLRPRREHRAHQDDRRD